VNKYCITLLSERNHGPWHIAVFTGRYTGLSPVTRGATSSITLSLSPSRSRSIGPSLYSCRSKTSESGETCVKCQSTRRVLRHFLLSFGARGTSLQWRGRLVCRWCRAAQSKREAVRNRRQAMTGVISTNYSNRQRSLAATRTKSWWPKLVCVTSFHNQNTGTHLTDHYSLGNTDLPSDDVTIRLIDFCDRLIDYGKKFDFHNPIHHITIKKIQLWLLYFTELNQIFAYKIECRSVLGYLSVNHNTRYALTIPHFSTACNWHLGLAVLQIFFHVFIWGTRVSCVSPGYAYIYLVFKLDFSQTPRRCLTARSRRA
jgi:hypothetical protein